MGLTIFWIFWHETNIARKRTSKIITRMFFILAAPSNNSASHTYNVGMSAAPPSLNPSTTFYRIKITYTIGVYIGWTFGCRA